MAFNDFEMEIDDLSQQIINYCSALSSLGHKQVYGFFFPQGSYNNPLGRPLHTEIIDYPYDMMYEKPKISRKTDFGNYTNIKTRFIYKKIGARALKGARTYQNEKNIEPIRKGIENKLWKQGYKYVNFEVWTGPYFKAEETLLGVRFKQEGEVKYWHINIQF